MPPAGVESFSRPWGTSRIHCKSRASDLVPWLLWFCPSHAAVCPAPCKASRSSSPPGLSEAPPSRTLVCNCPIQPRELFLTHTLQSAIRTRCFPGGAPLRTGLGGPSGSGVPHAPEQQGPRNHQHEALTSLHFPDAQSWGTIQEQTHMHADHLPCAHLHTEAARTGTAAPRRPGLGAAFEKGESNVAAGMSWGRTFRQAGLLSSCHGAGGGRLPRGT